MPWYAADGNTARHKVCGERGFFPPLLLSPLRGFSISAEQTGSFAAEARVGEEPPAPEGGSRTGPTGSQEPEAAGT